MAKYLHTLTLLIFLIGLAVSAYGANDSLSAVTESEVQIAGKSIRIQGKSCGDLGEASNLRVSTNEGKKSESYLLSGKRFFYIHGKTMESGHYTCVDRAAKSRASLRAK